MHGTLGEKQLQVGLDSWHGLLVKAGSEVRVCSWLKWHVVRPYWPRYRTDKRIQGRRQMQWRSVMPGYVFVPAPTNFAMVQQAPSVRKFLCDGQGNIVQIPHSDIERIKQIELALNESAAAAAYGVPFRKGQRVWIIPWEAEGVVTKVDSRKRILVEARMFGSVVPLTVAVEHIASV